MITIDCLTNLIGLSNHTCECTGADKPTDPDVSLSGFYVDDAFDGVPLNWVKQSAQCEDTLWVILQQARTAAILQFREEFTALFQTFNKSMIKTFNGQIGEGITEGKVNQLVIDSGLVKGIEITPSMRFRGSSITIDYIGLMINLAGPYTVTVKRKDTNAVLGTYVINTAANQNTTLKLPTPLELPLVDSYNQLITYSITYEPGASTSWNVMLNCMCGGDSNKPYNTFINVIGVSDGNYNSSYTYGLTIGAIIGCRSEAWICDTLSNPDSDFTIVMAKTLQVMANLKLLDYIMKTGKINYWTFIAEDKLPYLRNKLKKELYRVEWLAANAPEWVSDCFKCKTANISKGSIVI